MNELVKIKFKKTTITFFLFTLILNQLCSNLFSLTWQYASNMPQKTINAASCKLLDGRVLVVGGWPNGLPYLTTAQIYTPISNTWSVASPMSIRRRSPTATLLKDGKVLVVGGWNGEHPTQTEIYDPKTNTWSLGGNLPAGMMSHNAVLLQDGSVLVCGGFQHPSTRLNSCYSYKNGVWETVGSLSQAKSEFAMVKLPNGKVLAIGGRVGSTSVTSTCEVYDPFKKSWSSTGSLNVARSRLSASVLQSGKVLVCGGLNNDESQVFNSCEIYDPQAGSWSFTGNLNIGRCNNFQDYNIPGDKGLTSGIFAILPSGEVLMAGGVKLIATSPYWESVSQVEIYNPVTMQWRIDSNLTLSRSDGIITLLNDSSLFLAGGINSQTGVTSTTERSSPAAEININNGYANVIFTSSTYSNILSSFTIFVSSQGETYFPGSIVVISSNDVVDHVEAYVPKGSTLTYKVCPSTGGMETDEKIEFTIPNLSQYFLPGDVGSVIDTNRTVKGTSFNYYAPGIMIPRAVFPLQIGYLDIVDQFDKYPQENWAYDSATRVIERSMVTFVGAYFERDLLDISKYNFFDNLLNVINSKNNTEILRLLNSTEQDAKDAITLLRDTFNGTNHTAGELKKHASTIVRLGDKFSGIIKAYPNNFPPELLKVAETFGPTLRLLGEISTASTVADTVIDKMLVKSMTIIIYLNNDTYYSILQAYLNDIGILCPGGYIAQASKDLKEKYSKLKAGDIGTWITQFVSQLNNSSTVILSITQNATMIGSAIGAMAGGVGAVPGAAIGALVGAVIGTGYYLGIAEHDRYRDLVMSLTLYKMLGGTFSSGIGGGARSLSYQLTDNTNLLFSSILGLNSYIDIKSDLSLFVPIVFNNSERYGKVPIDNLPPAIIVESTQTVANILDTFFQTEVNDINAKFASQYGMLVNNLPQSSKTQPALPSVSKIKIRGGEKGFINPSKGETATIYFNSSAPGKVKIKIYTLQGTLLKEISKDTIGGNDSYEWNCHNNHGDIISSGVYIVYVEGPGIKEKKKLIILR